MTTSKKVIKFQRIQNKRLLDILERVELDKPILMHDKLQTIWDNSKFVNHHAIKKELDSLKHKRQLVNNAQQEGYNKCLDFLFKREYRFYADHKKPVKSLVHEKEREFMECLRLIIQSGYAL